jgi:hypothetical protein
MVTYTKHTVNGQTVRFSSADAHAIPEVTGNYHYDNMMQEVADGLAEIIEVDDTPVPTYTDLRVGPDGYATQGEQNDMQYHDSINGTTTWVDHVEAVKTKYPKG